MNRKFCKLFSALIIGLQFSNASSSTFAGDIVVITNPASGITQLEKDDLVRIFMTKTDTYPNEKPVTPVTPKADSDTRIRFDAIIIERNPMQIRAYWTRLLFTGRGSPPPALDSDQAIIDAVRKDPAAIGYISAESLDNTVQAVYTIKE